jgi:hypothetical protein
VERMPEDLKNKNPITFKYPNGIDPIKLTVNPTNILRFGALKLTIFFRLF